MPDDHIKDEARKIGTGGGDYTEGNRTEQRVDINLPPDCDDPKETRESLREVQRLLEFYASQRRTSGVIDIEGYMRMRAQYPQLEDALMGAAVIEVMAQGQEIVKQNQSLNDKLADLAEQVAALGNMYERRTRNLEIRQYALILLMGATMVIAILAFAKAGGI